MNGKEIIKQLTANGWVVLRQEGSHVRLGKGAARTTVPLHGARDIRAGTLASIERQTGVKATLNKSVAVVASRLWAVCFVANARDTFGYRCALRLASHPKAGRANPRGLIQRYLEFKRG